MKTLKSFWDVTLHCWASGSHCFKHAYCLQNTENDLPSDTPSHPRRLESSTTQM